MASENLALVIETSKRGTALQETIADVGRLGQAATVAEKQVGKVGTTMLQFPTTRTRQGAMAVREIAYAAESATLGGKAATVAFGNLAQTLALTSRNAKFAAMATELGALVLLATTLYTLIQKINKEPVADAATSTRLAKADTLAEVQREYDRLKAMKQEAQQSAESGKFGSFEKLQQANANEQAAFVRLTEFKSKALAESRDKAEAANKTALTKAEADARTAAGMRLRIAADTAAKWDELEGVSAIEARRRATDRAFADEERAIRALNIPLAARLALMQQALDAQFATKELLERERTNTAQGIREEARTINAEDNPEAEYRLKLERIETERLANIKATEDVAGANALAEAKIRQLQMQRVKEGVAGFQRLATAVKGYGGFAVKAAQGIADAVRKFEILVQARKDAIKSKSEWAAGMAALGTPGAGWSAALHFAASAGYAAAAVAGGAEAVSGGGGGASGGGAGAGAGESTFEADRGRAGGDTVVNIIVRDEFGRERIAQTRYMLDRSRELKVPLPTTSGSRFEQRVA